MNVKFKNDFYIKILIFYDKFFENYLDIVFDLYLNGKINLKLLYVVFYGWGIFIYI